MTDFKFVWERVKEKKLAHSIIFLILVFIWLPTLTPDDLITIPLLVSLFGFKLYLTIALLLLAVSLIYFNGKLDKIKSLMKRPKEKEVIRICNKMHKTEKAINKCIRKNVLKNFEK